MTERQTQVLLLFAQDYSVNEIAKQLKISKATVIKKISSINKQYPKEFDNALSMRSSCKRLKHGLQHTQLSTIDDLDNLQINIE